MFRQTLLSVLLSTIWISASEFLRNEFLLKPQWGQHYAGLGLEFPDAPVNGAMWGLWSLLFAIALFVISRRFSFWESSALGWLFGFLMMWVVAGNLAVLPFGILPWAIPLSGLEVVVAVWISQRLGGAVGAA